MLDVDVTSLPSRIEPAAVKAGPGETRRHNLSLVLQQINERTAVTRANIARVTGLTRVAVSSLVAELMDLRLVREVGVDEETTRPGKRATLLDLDLDHKRIASLDLSAHGRLDGAVTDLRGTLLHQVSLPIHDLQGSELVTRVVALADQLEELAGEGLIGIGVGTPGKIVDDGVVEGADRLGWRDVALKQVLSAGRSVPVFVGNDADFAALAESESASGDMLLIYLARGVGARVILGGRIVGGAGEIGHISVVPDGPPCFCGKRGCLETLVSTAVLSEQLAHRPDEAEAILAEAGERLGAALSVSIGLLDVPEIVLHGPKEIVTDALLVSTAKTINRRNHTVYRSDVVVRPGLPGVDLVLQGAHLRVWSGVLGA